jgi:hypothetical protein
MDKLTIAAIDGSIKRNPKVLKKWFGIENFVWCSSLAEAEEQANNIDIYVQTNLLKYKFFIRGRDPQYVHILTSSKPKLVQESSMFRSVKNPHDKKQLQRLGWNSYQYGEADYNNENSPPDRWKMIERDYQIQRRDWKRNGEYVLLLLQKPGDSSLNKIYIEQGYRRYEQWIIDTVKEIRKHTDRKIRIRPHINQQTAGYRTANRAAELVDNCEVSPNYEWHPEYAQSGGAGLQEDLKNAWCSVTYNSLSSVESIMSGTPVVTLDKTCMAWPVSEHSLKNIETINRDRSIDQWLYDCAYTSWCSPELASGEAWAHLKPRYEHWKKMAKRQDTNDILKWKQWIGR